ncbi:hypothetical protein SEA_SATIS_181 [Streptomyces phage Satis]|nr:hypothetical protein SEA_SATIS_181 [Streptomyces phage Satis]QBZ72077.1 hypothetical protein SEA_KRADAL_181 [Streptomyces phage Kradal]QPL14497.1 hypothetical protein SEA_EHYELIMAYOE_182 [Streptomyces phage EhyElimayoE]
MGHEASVIDGALMREFGGYARTAPLPMWVVAKLHSEFETLGLYSRILSAAAEEDDSGPVLRVTASKDWGDLLFRDEGSEAESMKRLLEIGAITKVAEYQSGKVRLQMEPYPPEIREEIDAYRRPNGKLVAVFS